MNKIKYIIQILTVLIFLGCTEDEWTGNKGDIQVVAGFATTRTTFVEDNGTTHVNWNTGDAIGLFTDEQDNLQYTALDEGNETNFSAVGEKLKAAEGKTVYAYYPYSYEYGENQHRVKLPDLFVQNYKENASEQDFIYASGNVTNNKLSLQFKHLFAFLKITIPMELIADRGENGGLLIRSSEKISCNSYFDLEKTEIVSEKYNEIRYCIPVSEEIEKKKEITCYIAILPQTENTEIKIYHLNNWDVGNYLLVKDVPLGGFKAGNVYTLYLNGDETNIERDALIAFYNATGGDNWKRKDNWCSDKPVNEWYGITCESGFVNGLYMFDNNLNGMLPVELANLSQLQFLEINHNYQLSGELPPELGNLTKLITLVVPYNNFSGVIPPELGNLVNLELLGLYGNRLEGSIPPELGKLVKLWNLNLSKNQLTGSIPTELGKLSQRENLYVSLSDNKLTGEIPESIGELKNLVHFSVINNSLSGKIPKSFMQLDFWQYTWPWILGQDGEGFERSSLILPGPKFSVRTYTNEPLDQSIYAKNKYTILLQWGTPSYSIDYITKLKIIYNNYKKKGLEIVGYTHQLDNDGIAAFASRYSIPWPMFRFTSSGPGHSYLTADQVTEVDEVVMLGNTYCPSVNLVDSEDNILIDSHYYMFGNPTGLTQESHIKLLSDFFQEKLGDPDPIDPDMPDDPNKPYESTDYSKDGNVTVLQRATEGKGIDIVLMGDAYSDHLIADGTYETVMKKAADFLFTEEPFKTYRNLFNVYMVDVVSKNEVYGGETALSTYFGDGTLVGGDDNKCFEYAQEAISGNRINEALIIVMINSTRYAGTCYMYYPNDTNNDYGSGPSIAYFPLGTEDDIFEQLLHHEANGHGFSKLADEYAYQEYGTIPADEIAYYQDITSFYGWWKNVDFTNDPAQVKWSKYLSDSRYANDGLGIFEGACTYWTGAYRPTDFSIMRYNTDGFNAPSRESIYYRIHKLAYGTPWVFNYEDFVAYDAKNRKAATRAAAWSSATVKRFREKHCPPVVIRKNWRNAK